LLALLFLLITTLSMSTASTQAFDSSEIRLLEAQNAKRHLPLFYPPSLPYYHPAMELIHRVDLPIAVDGDKMIYEGQTPATSKRSALRGAPLIRFGKRALSRGDYHDAMVAPRSLRMDQPLIRFGKRGGGGGGVPQFGSAGGAPLIRFGKRDAQYAWMMEQPHYARFNRNPRPNPVEEEDTMLRFG
jgi:hypothetical protein